MRHSIHLALFATLVAGTGWSQDVAVSTTSIAQTWKQDTPGMSKGTFTPVTEFVGVDVAKISGQEALSFHMYGWGFADLADQSSLYGKHTGDLTYGYLQYNFTQANAELKAGRFTVNQGVGNEQVDGVSGRTDLRHDFTVSGFLGRPVVYKNEGDNHQQDIRYQQNVMFGARVAWHPSRLGEIGLDYLQDGSYAAKALNVPVPQPVDYTRRQVGLDMVLTPCSFIDLRGRTVFDAADNQTVAPGTASPSRIAEHDYSATAKLPRSFTLTGTFVERNYFAYYAGSTLPNLFRQNEQGMFKALGAKLIWEGVANLQVSGDVRRTDRALYGVATRTGADVRYNFSDAHVLAGAGVHKTNAFNITPVAVVPAAPGYSVSNNEMRAWVMAQRGKVSASLDAILIHYTDASSNPNLNGQSHESAVVGSLGYQPKANLKVSGDLTYEDNPIYRKQVMGLLRAQYQFGFSGKGGK